MSGGSQNTNTVQKSDPWSGQQPYLQYGFQQAQNNYQNHAPQYYPGATVAGFTPAQQEAMGLTEQRALNGSPVSSSAQNYMAHLENGDYLNSNPYLDGMYNSAASSVVRNFQNAVQPGISSSFEGSGRYGSGLAQNAQSQAQQDLGQSLGNMASTIYGNNYANTMDQMTKGAALAPMLASQDYTDLGQLSSVGAQQQSMNQAQLGDQVNRWNFYQNEPNQQLANYLGLIQGNYGGTTTTTSPYYTNPLMGAAGGAMTGYMAGSAMGGMGGAAAGAESGSSFGPYGALIGGLMGYMASR